MKTVSVGGQIIDGLDGAKADEATYATLAGEPLAAEVMQTNGLYKSRVELQYDAETGAASWYIRVVDQAKRGAGDLQSWPDDLDAGVLQPNVLPPDGEGYITYSVYVRKDAPALAVIDSSAEIVFDSNAAIVTDPAWWNTVTGNETGFVDAEFEVEEGESVTVAVNGGNLDRSSSVQLYLTYNTAAAADLDLAKGEVDGVAPKGGLKFPLTLSWAKGEIGARTVTIPVKTDKNVEGDEFFTLQLGAAEGLTVGSASVCTVTILDKNEKVLKPTVTPYKPKAGETVATNSVTVAAGIEKGGFVSGTGEYTAGSKLTLTAEPRPGWAFVGWRRIDGDDIVSDKAKWQVVVTNDEDYVAVFEQIPYVRGLADPADGGKVSGSGLCAAGKKVTLKATANKNFTFLGWVEADAQERVPPAGGSQSSATEEYIATTASLVIDRSAKPAASSKTSTTITNLTGDVTYFAVFKSDPAISVAVDTTDGTGAEPTGKGAGKYVAGTITGMGKYAPGKTKIALKAAANKGYVFNGWYDADGVLLTKDATYTIAAMGESDVEYTAKFVTAEEDKASISLAVNGDVLGAAQPESAPYQTNVWCGVDLAWPLAADALSATTIKVTGLPSGLKFTAKDIVDTKTKQVTVPANTIYGAPTAASKTDKNGNVTPSKVVFTVTTAGKSTQTFAINLYIDPLPVWAVGTFDGAADDGGIVQAFTVASNGKISGKILEGGRTWALAAASFSRVEHVEDGVVFRAIVIGKANKETFTNEVTVTAENGVGIATGGPQSSAAAAAEESLAPEWTAYQNLWKRADTKSEQPVIKKDIKVDLELGEPGNANDTVKVTFKKDGVVAFAGKVGGASVSGSSQLVLNPARPESAPYHVTLYAPPKATAKPPFDGWSETLAVDLVLGDQNVVTAVTLQPSEP